MLNVKKAWVLLIPFFLASCFGNEDPSSSSMEEFPSSSTGIEESSSSESPLVHSSSSSLSSSEETLPEPPSSSEEDPVFTGDISSILSFGEETLLGKEENELGYFFSKQKVLFTGRSFFYGSMISSKAGAGNPYWAWMGDASGFIYVAISASCYEGNAKKYAGEENQYFRIEGKLASFHGQTIVEATSFEFLPSPSFSFSNEEAKSLFPEEKITVEEAHQEIASLPINIKGCAYGERRVFEGKIVAKMDEGVFLFTDGFHYLKLHGTKTALSTLEPGFSYRIYGVLNEYIYAPGVEVIFAEGIDATVPTPASQKQILAKETYQWTYKNNESEHALLYESVFKDSYSIEGYVSSYQKDGAISFVINDSPRAESFSSYVGARDAKCLFLKNQTETNLKSEMDFSCSILAPFDPLEKVKITFVPYLWNTNKYFQGYLCSAQRI